MALRSNRVVPAHDGSVFTSQVRVHAGASAPAALAICFAALVGASCSGSETSSGAPSSNWVGDGEVPGTGAERGEPVVADGDVAFGASPPSGTAPLSAGAGAPATPGGASDLPTAGEGAGATGAAGAPLGPIGLGDTGAPPPEEEELPPPPAAEPGTLTAGIWDDNLNQSFFLAYRDDILQQATDIQDGYVEFSEADHGAAFDASELTPHQTLDIAFVIDTTGSMGDELAYLQTEFLSISERIEAAYPNAEQRWSLVVYKDEADEYVTRWFDFRDNADEFREHLAAQSAYGGGDFPEASHAALAAMNQLSWRDDAGTARLAFWVADAPHHAAYAGEMKAAIEDAQAQGIHLYPVASSGVDELTEFSMRSAAQLTGGRYMFLTDDSGVGGSHKEPTIPCYFVTRLDEALLRAVDVEMSGEHREPEANEIVRTVGAPEGGVCVTSREAVVHAF